MYKKFHGGAEAKYFGIAVSQIPCAVHTPPMENKVQDWNSSGRKAMDERSRDGKFSWRCQDVAIDFWSTMSERRDARRVDRHGAEDDFPGFEFQEKTKVARVFD